MGVTFTQDQQKAIEIKEKQVLLSAAAGSGKTAVIIEHIYQMITNDENNVSVENLLVLSFTDKASKEMKLRLLNRLNNELENSEDEEKINKLTEQINLLRFANISTIHSFCKKIIKQNFNVVDLDPSFNLSDSAQTELLKQEAIIEVMDLMYEKNDDVFLETVEYFGDKVLDNGLIYTVLKIYNFSMSSPFPKKWLQQCVDNYNILDDVNVNDLSFTRDLVENLVYQYEQMNKSIDNIIEQLKYDENLKELYDDALLKKKNIETIIDTIKKDISSVYYLLQQIDNTLLPTKRGKDFDKELYTNIRESYKVDIRQKRMDIESVYFYKPFLEFINDIKNQKRIIEKLVELVNYFDEIFTYKKRERNLLDYNDLEHFAIKILLDGDGNPTECAKDYQKQFHEIMVDEFQDTNLVQEAILNSLINRDLPYKNKYMVGDVKQSIYRFRKASPQIFIDNYNEFSKNENEYNQVINLSKNFRSRKGVIDGVNYIFEQIMIENFGGINYDENAKLHLGRTQLSNEDDYITFLLLEETKEEQSDLEDDTGVLKDVFDSIETNVVDEEIKQLTSSRLEAMMIAKEIHEIVNGDNPLFVEDNGQMRKTEYQDVTILLRSFTNLDIIIEELNNLNIPSTALNQSDYFYLIEVKTILSILYVIDNRTLDISLITVLTSPIYGITPEELLIVRHLYKDMTFYLMIEMYVNEHENELSDKFKVFLNHLNKWRKANQQNSITELLWLIFNDTNYLNIAKASKKGEQAHTNLMILLQKAEEYENSTKIGLSNFLKFVEKSSKAKVKINSATSNSAIDAVNIMTIHKSKGLEFKVVFQSFTGKLLNTTDQRVDLVMHDEKGIGFKYLNTDLNVRYDTLMRRTIIDRTNKERLHEEIRLLYVCLTRACDKLYITGKPNFGKTAISTYEEILNSKNTDILKYISNAKTYFDFLFPALLKHKDFSPFLEYIGVNSVYIDTKSDVKFLVKMIDSKDLLSPILNSKLKEIDSLNEFDMSNIDLNNLYISNKIEKIPKNISIQEIQDIKLNKKRETSINYRQPSFLIEEKNRVFTGAQKGSILHKFLENIDFKCENNIEDLIKLSDELVKKQILEKEEVEQINFDKVVRFIQSDIVKRIKKSDKIYKEKAFAFYIDADEIYENIKDEKLLIHGVIDLYFYEGDNIVLVDYKTDFTTNQNLQSLIESYKIQLSIYKRVLEKSTNKTVSAVYVYSFYEDKILEIL